MHGGRERSWADRQEPQRVASPLLPTCVCVFIPWAHACLCVPGVGNTGVHLGMAHTWVAGPTLLEAGDAWIGHSECRKALQS